MKIFVDIETIPSQVDSVRERILDNITHPGNITKQESIDKWMEEKAPKAAEDAWRKTALDGAFGEVICAAWALDDGPVQSVHRDIEESERDLLSDFLAQIHYQTSQKREAMLICVNATWIGHYITGFDLRFLWQRCVVNKLKPAIDIPYKAKPWDDNVFDTLIEWRGSGSGVGKLDSICQALGIPGKGDMDGSQVWDYVKDGRINEVVEYCKHDVEMVRNVYKAMTFNKGKTIE